MPALTIMKNADGLWDSTPTYLFDHAETFRVDPHGAALQWFHEAHYGLAINFGLYSLIGKGREALANGEISPAEYERLPERFSAEHFDAQDIVEFAIANGMRYLEFTVRDAEGFSLYNSQVSDFNCARSKAKRDLLGEIASVCEFHGVGLCLRYSHGRDWRHPHAPESRSAASEQNLAEYTAFVEAQIKELLTQYGPIAALCLDGIDAARAVGPEKLLLDDLYQMAHFLQPQILLSYQQGVTGGEDFFTAFGDIPPEDAPEELAGHIHRQNEKPVQIREPLTPGNWGYHVDMAGKHLKTEDIWKRLRHAGESEVNFLLGTNLMPDGSLDLEDINPLLTIGERIEKHGFPGVR
ncbi:MAG: alpha-L-fucosidase [Victivallales bacterium]|nr:alpha-L-fucosidase [Victivallales bacterium]